MAFLTVQNVALRGIAACVPKAVEANVGLSVFSNSEDATKFILSTGIERRRVADKNVCTSDLCFAAADKLIDELDWEREEIDCLIFVTQTPDYILPATLCVLQDRLGLSQECYTLDISLGCSGWVYGMSVISNLLSSGSFRKGLLLAGDTLSKITSKGDKSAWPLFGDAGTAVALELADGAGELNFNFHTDGSGYQAIMIPDGGCRIPYSLTSLDHQQIEDNISRNALHIILNGMDVFSFGISKAPQSVNKLLEKFDYFLFHQANRFMNEKIRKKLKLTEEQVPYSLLNFGNTSSATIPLTMVTELRERLSTETLKMVACGFGVGLSWGSVCFVSDKICVPILIEL